MAALVIAVLGYFLKNDLISTLVWLIITIVLFYFIGLIIKHTIDKYVFPEEPEEPEEELEGQAEGAETETVLEDKAETR